MLRRHLPKGEGVFEQHRRVGVLPSPLPEVLWTLVKLHLARHLVKHLVKCFPNAHLLIAEA